MTGRDVLYMLAASYRTLAHVEAFARNYSKLPVHYLSKVGVEGSSPFARSRFSWYLNYFR